MFKSVLTLHERLSGFIRRVRVNTAQFPLLAEISPTIEAFAIPGLGSE
jgi:hypothetical protein